jgi:hypothetical protein
MLDNLTKKRITNNQIDLNIESFVNTFESEISANNSLFKLQNFKQFIEKTDDVNKQK